MRLRMLGKVGWPFVIVSGLLLVLGVSGAWYVQLLQWRTSELLRENVASIRAAEEFELSVREMRAQLNRYLLMGDRSRLAEARVLLDQAREWFTKVEALATTPDEQRLAMTARAGLERFENRFRQLEADDTTPPERLAAEVRGLADDLTESVIAAAREYLDTNEATLERVSAENQTLADRLVLALLLLGTCGAVAGLLAGYAAARSVRHSIVQLSVPVRDVAGRLGPVSVSADPDLEDLGQILERVAEEVTSVVDRLQASEREVMRADQLAAVGQLAAGMAHELRNPLMCMKLLVQSATRRNGGTLAGRDLEVLDEEIVRLEELVRTFLDFARPAKLEAVRVDLREVVSQTLLVAEGKARRRGVEFGWQPPNKPCDVEADPGQIRQALLNLLLNALDAVADCGEVIVGLERLSGAEPSIALSVLDNGCGLPAGVANRVFEPFFSTKETGLGLGLAISKRIAESHGGTLSAVDRPGGGTIFTVRLPALAIDSLEVQHADSSGR